MEGGKTTTMPNIVKESEQLNAVLNGKPKRSKRKRKSKEEKAAEEKAKELVRQARATRPKKSKGVRISAPMPKLR